MMLNTQAIIEKNIAAIDAVIAATLEISPTELSDDLGYQSICQWDSLRHVSLMLRLEEAFGIRIDQDLIAELRDCRTIREYFSKKIVNEEFGPLAPGAANVNAEATLHRGLANVQLDETHISRIDGDAGILEYRGYSIHDLATHASFEEKRWS